jgi:polyisoprenoid-binding protein YceI
MRFAPVLLAAATLAACNVNPPAPDTSPAAWTLVPEQSRLSFVSVKASEIAEVHHFARLDGAVGADGKASVSIPLDAVVTGIEIRDERMRNILFETGLFPTATITAEIDMPALSTMAVGEQKRLPLRGELSLHAATTPIETEVVVTHAGNGRVIVASLDPVVVNAASFGFTKGLAELQKLANLPSITPDVPVSFQLTFARKG